MHRLGAILILSTLATPLFAQSIAVRLNDQPMGVTDTTSDPNIRVFRHVFQAPMVIVAAEFLCGSTTGTASVFIFDHDPATDGPGTLLARGNFSAPSTRSWAGAVLDRPVVIPQANETRWLGMYMSMRALTPTTGRSANAPTYYWTPNVTLMPPIAWNGPFGPPRQATGFDWMYRLYGPGGTGQTDAYGQGKPGTHGTPELELWGWPNLGNPLTLTASRLPGSSAGVLVFGRRANLPSPLGTIYALPVLAAVGFTTGPVSAVIGHALPFLFSIPNDPALLGGRIAWQVWMVDPGAALQLSNTDGIEVTIG